MPVAGKGIALHQVAGYRLLIGNVGERKKKISRKKV